MGKFAKEFMGMALDDEFLVKFAREWEIDCIVTQSLVGRREPRDLPDEAWLADPETARKVLSGGMSIDEMKCLYIPESDRAPRFLFFGIRKEGIERLVATLQAAKAAQKPKEEWPHFYIIEDGMALPYLSTDTWSRFHEPQWQSGWLRGYEVSEFRSEHNVVVVPPVDVGFKTKDSSMWRSKQLLVSKLGPPEDLPKVWEWGVVITIPPTVSQQTDVHMEITMAAAKEFEEERQRIQAVFEVQGVEGHWKPALFPNRITFCVAVGEKFVGEHGAAVRATCRECAAWLGSWAEAARMTTVRVEVRPPATAEFLFRTMPDLESVLSIGRSSFLVTPFGVDRGAVAAMMDAVGPMLRAGGGSAWVRGPGGTVEIAKDEPFKLRLTGIPTFVPAEQVRVWWEGIVSTVGGMSMPTDITRDQKSDENGERQIVRDSVVLTFARMEAVRTAAKIGQAGMRIGGTTSMVKIRRVPLGTMWIPAPTSASTFPIGGSTMEMRLTEFEHRLVSPTAWATVFKPFKKTSTHTTDGAATLVFGGEGEKVWVRNREVTSIAWEKAGEWLIGLKDKMMEESGELITMVAVDFYTQGKARQNFQAEVMHPQFVSESSKVVQYHMGGTRMLSFQGEVDTVLAKAGTMLMVPWQAQESPDEWKQRVGFPAYSVGTAKSGAEAWHVVVTGWTWTKSPVLRKGPTSRVVQKEQSSAVGDAAETVMEASTDKHDKDGAPSRDEQDLDADMTNRGRSRSQRGQEGKEEGVRKPVTTPVKDRAGRRTRGARSIVPWD